MIAERGDLSIDRLGSAVAIMRGEDECLQLDADALRWLVFVGGPVALHAVGAVPRLPDPLRDRDEREHARNVARPLDAT